MIYTVKDGQTIYDIALQLYGSIEYVYTLINDNLSLLPNLDTDPIGGMQLTYTEQNAVLVNEFKRSNTNISTLYPIVSLGYGFSDGFSDGFN